MMVQFHSPAAGTGCSSNLLPGEDKERQLVTGSCWRMAWARAAKVGQCLGGTFYPPGHELIWGQASCSQLLLCQQHPSSSPVCAGGVVQARGAGAGGQWQWPKLRAPQDHPQPSFPALTPCAVTDHRNTKLFRLEGTSGDNLTSACQGRVSWSRLHRRAPRWGLNVSRGRLHNLPGRPVPVLCQPQCEVVFLHVEMEIFELWFMAIVPCHVAGHQWKEPGTTLLTPVFEIFICVDETPSQSSLLQTKWA